MTNSGPSDANPAISGARGSDDPPPAAITLGQPQAASVPVSDPPVIILGQQQAAGVPRGNPPRVLPRTQSDTSDDAVVDKVAKRRKNLSETLLKLRRDIQDAAAKDMWWSNNTWNHDTVAVLLGDLLQVIESIVEEKRSSGMTGVEALFAKVTDFLHDLFCLSPMFEHAHHFKHVFPTLQTMGCEMTGAGRLITMLAGMNANGEQHFDMTQADVVDRIAFRGTPLFQSYCDANFSNALDKARIALCGQSGSATEDDSVSAKRSESGSDAGADWSATGGPPESNIADCKHHLEFALQIRPVNQVLIDH